MVDFCRKPSYGFEDLVEIVRILRAPDGCPWDSVQTHQSIRRNFLEEVYEACEAIDRADPDSLREELGDVLLHVVFHASIEQDAGRFDIDDVCDTVVKKMISRHPALFGGEAGLSWDEIKRREKGYTTLPEELDSVARSLPALWRAEKMQKKAASAGCPMFDEIADSLQASEPAQQIGEMLFRTVALARQAGVDPEQALHQYCDAFLAQIQENTPGQQ